MESCPTCPRKVNTAAIYKVDVVALAASSLQTSDKPTTCAPPSQTLVPLQSPGGPFPQPHAEINCGLRSQKPIMRDAAGRTTRRLRSQTHASLRKDQKCLKWINKPGQRACVLLE